MEFGAGVICGANRVFRGNTVRLRFAPHNARLQGKCKVSQNRKVPDRLGVAVGLDTQAAERSLSMAELVTQRARPAS
jgi:predicted FMN-binding regulatory protein PaiB